MDGDVGEEEGQAADYGVDVEDAAVKVGFCDFGGVFWVELVGGVDEALGGYVSVSWVEERAF